MTLTSLLARRAERCPDELAYAFLPDGLHETERMTWGQLSCRSLGLAARLVERVPAGGRVLLLLEPGLELVVAVHACFAARLVGVPAAPPAGRQRVQGLGALQRVATDAGVVAILTTAAMATALQPDLAAAPPLAEQPWLLVDGQDAAVSGPPPALPAPARGDLAYLQYTSGSTSVPRGVMLTHEQFLRNLEGQRERWRVHGGSSVYSWLPPWHDMGLVAGLMTGLHNGVPTYLAPPAAIGRRPLRWLQAISDLRVTMSGAPDFMFRLCAARATPEFVASLDLSAWEMAFSGAEPVRASTVAAFTAAFAPAGLRPTAITASYGLAEATLLVTAPAVAAAPTVRTFDRASLGLGQARERGDGMPLVSCGSAVAGQQVVIVDPTSRTRTADGEVGELWTRGASTALGYWQRPDATEQTFAATIVGEPGAWLRTGDLAFIDRGEVFIAGRLKDVVIANGANHHAIDIELVVQESHAALATRATAAFALEGDAAERLVIVIETPSDGLAADEAQDALTAARRAVAGAFDLMPERIVLVPSGEIPKTTSGKVQRGQTRDALTADQLPISWEWSALRASPV